MIGPGQGYSIPSNGFNLTHSERFFYDGTRRIQELVTDPVVVSNEDGDVPTMGSESQQRGEADGESGGGNSNAPEFSISYLRAQYVWGPGDSPTNGADELLCQLDPMDTSSSTYANGGGKPWYVLTDAQGDVVSVVHVPNGTNTSAEVGGQWTYSPYGEVLTYEQLHPHPAVVFGHKTLPVDRLDGEAVGWSATAGMSEAKRLEPGARLLSYARNRTLDSKHGRWLQEDPNASGASVVESICFFGAHPSSTLLNLSLEKRLVDGLNITSYQFCNPLIRSDPTGLFTTAGLAPLAPGMAMSILWNGLSGALLGGVAGGAVGGGMSSAMGGNFWDGAVGGAIAGATTGGLGGAFGASASGLFGMMLTNGAGGFTSGLYQSGGNIQAALASAWWSAATVGLGGIAGKGFMAAAGSVGASRGAAWAMSALERGKLLDRMYKRILGGALPDNFPVIDCFQNGTATSIKSMDLAASSYSSSGAVTSTLRAVPFHAGRYPQWAK